MIAVLARSLIQSLVMTLAVEVCGAWLLKVRDRMDLMLVILVNILTNLPLVLILDLLYIYHRGYATWYLIGTLELIAFWVEGAIYSRYLGYRGMSPFLLSLMLNGLSYFGGWILT